MIAILTTIHGKSTVVTRNPHKKSLFEANVYAGDRGEKKKDVTWIA